MISEIPSNLILENKASFSGFSPEWVQGTFPGEVVFTTGMTGYPESLTDPSYTGQILLFTYPLIGNYGIPPKEDWESRKIHLNGVIVSEACHSWSHHAGLHSLLEWLKIQKVPVITGVDTRAVTKILRSSGTMMGAISTEKNPQANYSDPNLEHLVSRASRNEIQSYGNGNKTVIAIDCGMKENIIRSLIKFPIHIKRVPHNYDFTNEPYDGVFISNGPGDPMQCKETIAILKKVMKGTKPIFGICLGTQLMALASGASTYKLPFGHRGQNQPCIELETNKCYITSQNHGFAVDEKTLANDWKESFKNLNDGSVEGIMHKEKPFFSVQFHPEASPGPTDTLSLFNKFYDTL
jgi:carbamoyl-phosphate synthase small subunit